MRTVSLLMLLLALALAQMDALHSAEAVAGRLVWVAGESYKIFPNGKAFDRFLHGNYRQPFLNGDYKSKNTSWNAKANEIELWSAKNEYVAFQVVVEAGAAPIESLTVEVSELSGPGKFPKTNFSLFRIYNHTLTRRVWEWGGSGLPVVGNNQPPPTEFPDATIPSDIPDWGLPMKVATAKAGVVWVDVHAPKSTTSGVFKGRIKVKNGNETLASLNLTLHIWDFTLPEQHHLPFRGCVSAIERGYKIDVGTPEGVAKYRKIERDIWRMLRRHRIDACPRHTRWPSHLHGRPKITGTGKDITVDWTEYDKRFAPILNGSLFENRRAPEVFYLPIWLEERRWPKDDVTWESYLREVVKHFDKKKWDITKTFIYLSDEAIPKQAPQIIKLADIAHRVDRRLKLAIFGWSTKDQKEAYDLLKDSKVNVWWGSAAGFDVERMAILKRQGHGIGLYHNDGEPRFGRNEMDGDGVTTRVWPWIAWKYGADYLYMYTFTLAWWKDDGNAIWDKCDVKAPAAQGIWLWPGHKLNAEKPIGGLRIKGIRRGLQDYEYLWLAKKKGGDVKSIVDEMIPAALSETKRGRYDCGEWPHDPMVWLETRKKLAAMILKK